MAEVLRRGTKGLLRELNNSRVLQLIHARGPISRAEIARLAELPPPTVTAIVSDFLSVGLVQEADGAAATVGRPGIMLSLNPHAGYAAGVKLRHAGLTVALTDLQGTIVRYIDRVLATDEASAVLGQVAAEVKAVVADAGVAMSDVLGLGIGVPGLIDHLSGACRFSSHLGWRGVQVKRDLEGLLDLSVYVDNDVNTLTAAEIAHGAGREVRDFLTVTVGSGIGLGIVSRGEVYHGAFGGAGEFGHTKTEYQAVCDCGAIGCLEAVASEQGITQRLSQLRGEPVTIDPALELAQAGDTHALSVFEEAGTVFGRCVGNLLNLFNPELVIVTGEGVRLGEVLLAPMRRAIHAAAFDLLGQDTRIEIQQWGDEAWAQGAAGIVVHDMFKPRIYESAATGPLARLLTRGRARANR